MVLIFSCIWSGTLQTIVKLLWTCIIPKGILLLLFLCISWRDGNVKLVFCILGSAAGAWNTRLHLFTTGLLILLWVGRTGTSPYTLLCGLSTFYRLPSTCFLLHKPELVFKFANKILDYYWRGGKEVWNYATFSAGWSNPCFSCIILVQLSFLLPAASGTIVGIE